MAPYKQIPLIIIIIIIINWLHIIHLITHFTLDIYFRDAKLLDSGMTEYRLD